MQENKASIFSPEGIVRRGAASDLPFVFALERACFPDPWDEDALAPFLSASHLSFLVYEEEEHCLGYLLGSLICEEGEIYRVAVSEAGRRRGVGRLLCATYLESCTQCDLEVRRGNCAARALYESLGFTLVGERKNYYKNPTEDACLYRRKL